MFRHHILSLSEGTKYNRNEQALILVFHNLITAIHYDETGKL